MVGLSEVRIEVSQQLLRHRWLVVALVGLALVHTVQEPPGGDQLCPPSRAGKSLGWAPADLVPCQD
jgi:hypothetical protein